MYAIVYSIRDADGFATRAREVRTPDRDGAHDLVAQLRQLPHIVSADVVIVY